MSFDFIKLMKNAKKIQSMAAQTQADLAKVSVVGEAGAGAVKVTLSGKHRITAIEVDDETAKESKEIWVELIMAAANQANEKLEEHMQSSIMETTGGLGLDLGDLFKGDDSTSTEK